MVPAEEEAPILLQHEGLLQGRGVGRLLPPVEAGLHLLLLLLLLRMGEVSEAVATTCPAHQLFPLLVQILNQRRYDMNR